jgi:RimJ/RimL family protein N-acetyltransferase
MIAAPSLTTSRLRLRPHERQDFEPACAMWADPQVTRFIGGRASTPQQTWSRMLAYLGHWSIMGYGYWAIEEQATGAFIGEVGFADFRRDIAPEMRDVPELGFALVSNAHGKGYASEAVSAALAWADEHVLSKRTVCLIDEANRPSLRIAQKCGYRAFQRTTFNGTPVQFLERTLALESAAQTPCE